MATLPKRYRPRKEPRQRRSEETRGRILEAAARVFAHHGYAAGTTNRIADEAELSVGSLYQYFPNKDAILLKLVRGHVAEGVAAIEELLEDAGGLPGAVDERVRLFVRASIRAHTGDPRLHRVLFEESPRPREMLDELHALERSVVESVARILDDDPAVHVGDPRLAAWIVVTTIESLTHRSLAAQPEHLDTQAFEDEVVTLLVRYLQADRPDHASC